MHGYIIGRHGWKGTSKGNVSQFTRFCIAICTAYYLQLCNAGLYIKDVQCYPTKDNTQDWVIPFENVIPRLYLSAAYLSYAYLYTLFAIAKI